MAQFEKIIDKQLQSKGVAALADKPNASSSYGKGSLSAAALKAWFDNLGNLLAKKINEIIDVLNGGTDSDGNPYYGSDYISIPTDNLSGITNLTDLINAITDGSFAAFLAAYQSADAEETTDLQSIIYNFAKYIADLQEVSGLIYTGTVEYSKAPSTGFTATSSVLTMNETPAVGNYFFLFWTDNSHSSDIVYICVCLVTANSGDVFTWRVVDWARLTSNSLEDIELTSSEDNVDTYTITFTDGTTKSFKFSTKVDLATYTEEQEAQDSKISTIETSLANKVETSDYEADQTAQDEVTGTIQTRVTTLEGEVGDVSEFSVVAQNISTAIKSLNEDVDSLQLGVVPRIIRGLIYDEEPETLDDELKAALTAAVKEATGRDTPNNTDAVKVMDSAAPAEDSLYTYFYWSGEVSSDLDGWYLAEYYLSPSVTSIPSFVYVILNSSWTSEADENGLYYITISPDDHGMGTDNSINVDLHRLVDDDNYESINQFYVTATGTVILYTDEKFTGKLVIRSGRAYYIADTTATETVDMDQVDGLAAALAEKANTADLDEIATNGLQEATSTTLGGVKLGSDTVQTTETADVTTSSLRTYAVQKNSNGQLVVNVPWVNSHVYQSLIADNAEYPILIKSTTGISDNVQGQVYWSSKATLNPYTGAITSPSFIGDLKGNAKTATVAYKAPVAEVLIRVDHLSASDTSKTLSAARAMFTISGYDLINLFDTEALDTIKAMYHDEWLDLTGYELSLYAILNQLGHTGLENALPATGVFDGSSVMGIYAKRTDGEEEVYLDLYSSTTGRYSYLVETTDTDTEIEFSKVKFYLIMREDYVNYGV